MVKKVVRQGAAEEAGGVERVKDAENAFMRGSFAAREGGTGKGIVMSFWGGAKIPQGASGER